MMELAKRIVLFRAKHGLTQDEFAKRCNVSRITIYKIENGYDRLSKVIEAKIELVLGGENLEAEYKQDQGI